MARNKKINKVLSLLIITVMILGYFTSFVYAESGQLSLAKIDLAKEASNKITAEVKEDLEKEDLVEVLVYMRERVNSENIAFRTESSLSSDVTPYNLKLQVRRDVVEALRDKSDTTQVNILKYLEQEIDKGNVEEYIPYHIVNMIYVKANREVVENIAFMQEVEKIYKNKTYQTDNTMEYSENQLDENQLNATDLEWNIERVNADKVWELGYDGTGVVVATMDSGVDWTHPSLKEKWRGYNIETGVTNPIGNWFDAIGNEPLPRDPTRLIDNGRGTYVTGIMVGQEPNGSNKTGVAPGAKWIAARIFDNSGYTSDKILLQAAEWMLAPGGDPDNAPDVVNNSWNGLDGMNDWYRDIVRAWRAARIFPVFSVGQNPNTNLPGEGSILSPASYPESFAVTAVDINNIRATTSNQGPSPFDESIIKPDIAAPGVRIRSSIPGRGHYTGNYVSTSAAAPHISGVVALLLSANNTLSMDRIEEIIRNTAIPLTDENFPGSPNFGYGYGLVDALGAISVVYDGTGFIDGRVLQEGEDVDNAVIVHNQEEFEAYLGANVDIIANVSDDVSVTQVDLLVKQEDRPHWILIPMERIDGDHKSGRYKGTIDSDLLVGNSIIYKIKAADYLGEEVTTEDYIIDIKFGVIPGEYEEGFEGTAEGWRFGGSWEHGIPSSNSPQPYEGNSLAGTNIKGNYPDRADDWLITPPIDLRNMNLDTATLRFYEWYETENNIDKGFVLITNDNGQTWKEVRPFITGSKKEWREIVIILDDYIGSQTPVYIGFRLTSDVSGNRIGWYIDDVRLVGTDTEPPSIPAEFTAEAGLIGIRLNWQDVYNGDFSYYNIYRSLQEDDGYQLIRSISQNNYIDSEIDFATTYYYKIAAVDFSGNISEFSTIKYATLPDLEIIFGSDFEDNDGGYITGITAGNKYPWQWGIPTSGPNRACSGEKLWATNLLGDYEVYTDSYIESTTISIPQDIDPILVFNHWVDMQEPSKLDYGQVLISNNDGKTWTNITPVPDGKFGGYIKKWKEEQIPLTNYKGQNIKIRFFFHSNYSANYSGWYIDDVFIVGVENINNSQFIMDIGKPEELSIDTVLENNKKEYMNPVEPNFLVKETKIYEYKTIEDTIVRNIPMVGRRGIPVEGAVVTLLETGIGVGTNPATGRFRMRIQEGEYNLRAEAYGFYPQEVQVNIVDGKTTSQIFILEPKPQGSIGGRVVSRYHGNPIENANIRVVEDGKILPVATNEDGYFNIEGLYEGVYTLKISANDYLREEITISVVGNEITLVEIPLKKYVGHEDEIVYDDGTIENGLVLNNSNEGLAVRFTPPQSGKLLGTNMYFHGLEWPSPGGTRISIAVFIIDEYGNTVRVGSPKVVEVVRGQWNYIDLSEFNISTDKDFYISTIQTTVGSRSPGLGIDESSPYGNRSFLYVGGGFIPLASEGIQGSFAIRAVMEYSLGIPRITNLGKITYTNEDFIIIEGVSGADEKINIYINDQRVMSVEAENKLFYGEVELLETENRIMVTAEVNEVETSPSDVVKVIKDKEKPILIILEPLDNSKINTEVVHVIGNITDNFVLSKVLINNKETQVDEHGNFHIRLILDSGENLITIKALDKAGNETVIERTVVVDLNQPVISNIEPEEDITLKAGDILSVSFEAPTGGRGYFRLLVPNGLQSNNFSIPMTETNGIYRGTWLIPEEIEFISLEVELAYINQYGTEIIEVAPGRVTIINEEYLPMENLPSNSVIIGNEAFDINYLNTNLDAQAKLIEWSNLGKEVYIKLNSHTIVNSNGVLAGIVDLEDRITYYNSEGERRIYKK